MTSKTTNRFSPEVGSRAVRLLLDHEQTRAAVTMGYVEAVAAKISCTAQTLNE